MLASRPSPYYYLPISFDRTLSLEPAREASVSGAVQRSSVKMTSAVIPPSQAPSANPKTAAAAAAPPPRKRRRRTQAGGATDDCFTCRRRSVKCDRKRPYCTQCIEIGKECSGYKTTLTWGVGVASRGKLRGLSCPIASKNPDGTDAASPTEAEERKRHKSSVSAKGKRAVEAIAAECAQPPPYVPPGSLWINDGLVEGPQTPATPSLPIPIPSQQHSWMIPGLRDHREQQAARHASFSLPPLQHVQASVGSSYGSHVPQSGMSVSSYAESEFHSPMEYPQTPSSLPVVERFPHSFRERQTVSGPVGTDYGLHPGFDDPMSASIDSVSTNSVFPEDDTLHPSQTEMDPIDNILFNGGDMAYSTFDPFGIEGDEDEQNSFALADMRFSSPFFHLSPRLQSLMEYYDCNICPYLVAFDGPENPYRKHILQLALNNEGLQNALAALATNNLRMRKKEPRQIGFIEEITDAFDGSGNHSSNSYDASAEETMYKQLSIDQLNVQLTSPAAAQDDSVLATLLILCLFHVCDSGFSKFKTQLAGVQKLLSLRGNTTGRNGNPVRSDFTGWVEMFFTWFDVMTSTVNDREVQIQSERLDMMDFSTNLGALEDFSGCDGRLFKLIARLGRLNLLAQGRPVKRARGGNGGHPTLRPGNPKSPMWKRTASTRSLQAKDYENIDGNGWGTPIISSDEDAEGSADDNISALPIFREGSEYPDERKEFWHEWHDIHKRLQEWQMESSPNPKDPALVQGHRDLQHINESFRFSALLYITRLAHPILPSSHPKFQNLVSQALYHITALEITSCVNKFLLWPLFMVGTECVDEGHRAVIRQRCIEVQKESGFFNNLSGLEVLERVWRELPGQSAAKNDGSPEGRDGEEMKARRRDSMEAGRVSGNSRRRWGQAFRWRKAMDRIDGEYIII